MSHGAWQILLNDVAISGGASSALEIGSISGLGFGLGGFGLTPFGGSQEGDCGFGSGAFGEGAFGDGSCVVVESCLTEDKVQACLTVPPEGLGLPSVRTEDITYPQRDGVRHFNDWYEPRIITLEDVIVKNDGFGPGCSVREKVKKIVNAWSRQCDDIEMAIFTDCHGQSDDKSVVGPYGVIGRPRVAEVIWERSNLGVARLTLRFDAVDHRMYILDDSGCPGSGVQTLNLTSELLQSCRSYDRCYDGPGMCYDTQINPSAGPEDVLVEGDVCVYPEIVLNGPLTSPTIENVTTGEKIQYTGTIRENDVPVVIDTQLGTAFQGTASRTHLLVGNPNLNMDTGTNTMRLTSSGSSDTGDADINWRPAVISG